MELNKQTSHAVWYVVLYVIITPGGEVSLSSTDTSGRVASAISVVASGALARSISLPLDCVVWATAIAVGAIVAEDEWLWTLIIEFLMMIIYHNYLPQSISSEPSTHSGFPLQ
jgi:hypothetical protein